MELKILVFSSVRIHVRNFLYYHLKPALTEMSQHLPQKPLKWAAIVFGESMDNIPGNSMHQVT